MNSLPRGWQGIDAASWQITLDTSLSLVCKKHVVGENNVDEVNDSTVTLWLEYWTVLLLEHSQSLLDRIAYIAEMRPIAMDVTPLTITSSLFYVSVY